MRHNNTNCFPTDSKLRVDGIEKQMNESISISDCSQNEFLRAADKGEIAIFLMGYILQFITYFIIKVLRSNWIMTEKV